MEVARLIEQALARQASQPVGLLPIEAGTGTGKTLAYLVPGALHAASTGGKMLVSTHTIALGVQILTKDGPLAREVVRAATGQAPRIAHMRGRGHFVSPSRARAIGNLLRDDGASAAAWKPYLDLAEAMGETTRQANAALEAQNFSEATQSLVEEALIDRLEERHGPHLAWDDIRLLGSSPEEERAVHRLSRAMATEATILITTHAYTVLALARKALFDSAEVPFDLLVIDEADQWSAAAASVSLVSASMRDLLHSIEGMLGANRHAAAPTAMLRAGEEAMVTIEALSDLAPKAPGKVVPIADNDPALRLLNRLEGQVEQMVKLAATRRSHTAAAADHLGRKCEDLKRLSRALLSNETDFWQPRWTTSRVQGFPSLAISGRAPGRIMKRLWAGAEGAAPLARTIVLTSATLTTPGFSDTARWRSLEIAVGSDPSSSLVLSDLAASVQPTEFGSMRVRFADPRAPIPRFADNGSALPEADTYAAAVIRAAIADSGMRGGRTMVLAPSYADVERLAALLPDATPHRQGVPMQKMLQVYRGTPGCCLITPGAWAGVDLPGLIQNLVITRIPFPPRDLDRPDNGARLLSETLAKLAQGIGRLIRSENDQGTLWFADPRMPLPEEVTERTGLLPAPEGNPLFLAAIPQRFRNAFAHDEDCAAIAMAYEAPAEALRPRPRFSQMALRRTK